MNKLKYKVVDNFLTEDLFNRTKKIVTTDLPWFYSDGVSVNKIYNDFYFIHNFYENSVINSNFFDILHPLIEKIQPKALLRVKANLYCKTEKILHHKPHKDQEFPANGCIYYINTNNGFTVLKDGTKIESVANRALFFNSSIEHNSTTCTDENVRININFNYF